MPGRSLRSHSVGSLIFRTNWRCGAIVSGALFLAGCSPPPTATLTEFQPNTGRGGRAVAISVYTGDTQVAIAAGESGGLFQTKDGGQTWSHIDSLPAFRMSDVAFVPPVFTNPHVVIATAVGDANPNAQANQGGIWASSDGGVTWTHVVLPGSCANVPMSGYGIAFVATANVYVATDCGLLVNASVGTANWTQQSNWRNLYPAGLMSVSAQISVTGATAGAMIIDVCRQGGGHDRSQDSGRTWIGVDSGPDCQSSHSIAVSPAESNVVFATSGSTVLESDNGGASGSWFDLKAGSTSTRPRFVATHRSADQIRTHFDLYFSGRQITCSGSAPSQRCPADNGSWIFLPNVPNTNLNHDINGIAFDPWSSNCAMFEVSDFGVLKKGPPTSSAPCGDLAAWTLISNSWKGFGALQLYSIAGKAQSPTVGLSGYTTIAIGTMDNMEWVIHDDGGGTGWNGFGVEGSFFQVVDANVGPVQPPNFEFHGVDFGGGGFAAFKVLPDFSGGWGNPQSWTNLSPPGNGAPSFYVAHNTYVEWSGSTAFDSEPGNLPHVLYLTQDDGQSWVPIGTLPSNITAFNGLQVAQTPGGGGLTIYDMVTDANGNQGLAKLVRFLPPPASPAPFTFPTLGGTNDLGSPSNLKAIWGNCFGQDSWYCAPVFAADPNNYSHLYAADSTQKFVAVSNDAGETWREDVGLTNLITAAGGSMTDSTGNSQVHVFSFDPGNSSHILVGTDQAGIFASADGGVTWRALPNTAKATAITSFFFDDRTNTIFVGTYGRGLWKLVVDWTTVH